MKFHYIGSRANNHYYYEANANIVLKTNSIDLYAFQNNDLFKKYNSLPDNQIRRMEDSRKEFIYLCERLKNLNIVRPQDTITKFSSMIEGIRIIPISRCNMVCKYCLRKFSGQTMNIDVASKIVEFIENSPLSSRVHIKFYGGEPFLNFAVLEYIVEKIMSRLGRKISFVFSATTNGKIMSDIILNFLVKHKFYLAISLDGPPSIHNKNRLFRNGQSSFEVTFKNIRKIRDKNESYFNNYVFIQPTIPPSNYRIYKMAMDFFIANGFQNITISWLVKKNSTSLINRKIVNNILSNIKNHNYECIPSIDLIKYLDILRVDRCGVKICTCGAGVKRLAISPLGRIYPCEQLI